VDACLDQVVVRAGAGVADDPPVGVVAAVLGAQELGRRAAR
jgi:hypothetical protein